MFYRLADRLKKRFPRVHFCLPLALLPENQLESYQELSSIESVDPDPESMAISILELNAYRAERAYRKSLEDYAHMAARSATAHWTMDKWDRTY